MQTLAQSEGTEETVSVHSKRIMQSTCHCRRHHASLAVRSCIKLVLALVLNMVFRQWALQEFESDLNAASNALQPDLAAKEPMNREVPTLLGP